MTTQEKLEFEMGAKQNNMKRKLVGREHRVSRCMSLWSRLGILFGHFSRFHPLHDTTPECEPPVTSSTMY